MTLLLPEETHDVSFAMTSSFSCMMYATLHALQQARRVRSTASARSRRPCGA